MNLENAVLYVRFSFWIRFLILIGYPIHLHMSASDNKVKLSLHVRGQEAHPNFTYVVKNDVPDTQDNKS